MGCLETLADFYFVGIKDYHKHDYRRIGTNEAVGFYWPKFQCIGCEETSGLEQWQIDDLPFSMKYVPIEEVSVPVLNIN